MSSKQWAIRPCMKERLASDGTVEICKNIAVVTFHDRRGCLALCVSCCDIRKTQSIMYGHSIDCPGFPIKEPT